MTSPISVSRLAWAAALAVCLGLWSAPAAAVAPANDDFDSATAIVSLPFTDMLDTRDATAASDDPTTCTNNGSVWYALTPAASGTISADTFGSGFDTVLSVYTGVRGSLSQVPGACNDDTGGLQSRVVFQATAGVTYYFLIGFCCGSGGTGGGDLVFNVQELLPPPNDDFANAMVIPGVPFSSTADTSAATIEPSEPVPSCSSSITGSVWYAFTPDAADSFSATGSGISEVLAVYTGNSLTNLSEINCESFDPLTFFAEAGVTYFIQAGGRFGSTGLLRFNFGLAPPPEARFFFSPSTPSVFDEIRFFNSSFDPGGLGIESSFWDFGDGTTSTEEDPEHRYAEDGEYTVELTVTTPDGREDSTSQIVAVETHDVAITRFAVPKSASVGQTRTIVVKVLNKLIDDQVRVRLFRSRPGGSFEELGSSIQFVPARRGNRTTDFPFAYTFREEDAVLGKVNFKATAQILDAPDALPGDNELISPPTKVNTAGGKNP